METEETATVVRLVKSLFPQQPIDASTYETWHLVIGHLGFDDAQAAVISVCHSQRFCAASDIVGEAERASRRHAHPSERTAAEAIAESSLRELDSSPSGPPNAAYQRAKADLLARTAERDAALLGDAPVHPPVAAVARRLAYAVACPWCQAQPGARCSNTVLGTPKFTPHAARVEIGSQAA